MLRKTLTVTVLGIASVVAAGCASNNTTKADKPYALTGNPSYGVNGAGANSSLTATERVRATDDKGRFHPEWVGAVNGR